MVLVAAFGNPLLDIIVPLNEKTILEKYNLEEDGEKEVSSLEIKALLKDVSHLNPIFMPGGCSQNTVRILQWILAEPNSTIMYGTIGKDEQGKTLKKLIQAAGVQTQYIEHDHKPTGITVVLTCGIHRSLIAHIGAAQHYEMVNEDMHLLENVTLAYMEGFFLSERVHVAKFILEYCNSKNILFAFNLSGVYMITSYPKDMLYFAQNCDILIGNKREYEALIRSVNQTSDIKTFAVNLCQNFCNSNNLQYGKIVLITNGSEPLTCFHSGGRMELLDVPMIEENKVKDTNGAGDAFAAGFLGGLLSKQNPEACLKWGCWIAQQIIQQCGCSVPNYSADFLKSIN